MRAISVRAVLSAAAMSGVLAGVLVAAPASAGLASGEPGDGVAREGEGSRRTLLNEMELKPFPQSAWAALTEVSGGAAPSATSLDGKPVLVLTWSSWHPSGARAIQAARRQAAQRGKDGLVVVVVHHPEGFADAAAEIAKPAVEGQTVIFAHDAKGEFRKAIQSDQDPDFYVIDRAGQLRFADVTTDGVERACQIVTGETREQAAGINAQLAQTRDTAAREAARSAGIRGSDTLKNIPEQAFTPPGEEAYKAVRWPKPPVDPNNSWQNQQQQEERTIALPPAGNYLPSAPITNGRGLVLYFWNPSVRASYDGVMQQMDTLQRSGGRDLVVVGVVSPIRDANSNTQQNQPTAEEAAKEAERLLTFARSRNLGHTVLIDPAGALLATVDNSQTVPVPYAVVASSDGVVRYSGSANAAGFRGAVEAVLRLDPGVKARREAEEAFIRARGN